MKNGSPKKARPSSPTKKAAAGGGSEDILNQLQAEN